MTGLVHLLSGRLGFVTAALLAVGASLAVKAVWREKVVDPVFAEGPSHLTQARGQEARELISALAAHQDAFRGRFGTYVADPQQLLTAARVHRQTAANHPLTLRTGPTFYELVVVVAPGSGHFRLRVQAGTAERTCEAPAAAGCSAGRW